MILRRYRGATVICVIVAIAGLAVSGGAHANPLPLTDDIAPPPGANANGAASAPAPLVGNGFALIDGNFVSRPSYTLRLVESPNVELYRGIAAAAASAVGSASGVAISVAPGTVPDSVPDREPAAGEILLSVDDSTPCGPGFAGCGGPRSFSVRPSDRLTIVEGGRMWIYSIATGYTAAQKQHLVEHELGHALGLAHYDAYLSDGFQVMHPSSYDANTYRSGDRNGLAYLARPAELRWMSAAPRSSDRALVACLGTKFGDEGCGSPLWVVSAETEIGLTALGEGSSAVAFNSVTGNLGQCLVTNFLGANCWNSGAPIASGASPAVTTLTSGAASGSAIAGFMSPSTALQTCQLTSSGPANCANQGWVLAPGSGLGMVSFGDGSAAVAFRGAGGNFGVCRVTWFGGSNCASSGIAMAPGATAGVARIVAGASEGSAIAAFQLPSGALETCLLTPAGPTNCTNQGWLLAPGTSPTAAPLGDGSVVVAFSGVSSELSQCRVTWFGGSNCWTSGVGMAAGSAPGVTTLSTGTAMAAFRTAAGSLGTCELTPSGPLNCADHGWVVAAGTNPSASPFRDGSAAVSFIGGAGKRSTCRVTSFGGSNCWAGSQSTSSSPKIASIP